MALFANAVSGVAGVFIPCTTVLLTTFPNPTNPTTVIDRLPRGYHVIKVIVAYHRQVLHL